jgi:hypothetical protein
MSDDPAVDQVEGQHGVWAVALGLGFALIAAGAFVGAAIAVAVLVYQAIV